MVANRLPPDLHYLATEIARAVRDDLATEFGPRLDALERLAAQLQRMTLPVQFSASRERGRWITIGGTKGDDGKRHGGSAVYVQDGRITKGHPSLTGKRVDALAEDDDSTHRQQLNRAKGYGRAQWAKKAKQQGIEPKHLHQLAAELLEQDRAFVSDRKAVLKQAREALGEFGGGARTLNANVARGTVEQAGQVRGMDEVGEDLAQQYPHLFHGDDSPGDQLFALLRDGNPEAMTEDDAYEQALEQLVEHAGPVPFSLASPPLTYADHIRQALRRYQAQEQQ